MKKLSLILMLISTISVFAQLAPPQAFSYSGVARDAQNNPLANQTIGVQFSILQTSTTGPVVYQENHFTNTDAAGLFTLNIGTGAVQQGVFANINWGSDNFYLRLGLDPSGGTNFQTVGTTQFLTVPYALYAKSAGSVSNVNDNDTSSTNELQTLSLSGNTLSISNGNSVTLPSGNFVPSLEIPQQIPVYGLTLEPGEVESIAATTDGRVLILALDNFSNSNNTWLVRLERSSNGIYHPTHNTSQLNFRTFGMAIIDSFIYINANTNSVPSRIKRYRLSDLSFVTDMTYNPSAPQFANSLFTDGVRLFIENTNNQQNIWETFSIISTALINASTTFSFQYNGGNIGFNDLVVFDGNNYFIHFNQSNPTVNKLLKYDLNRNLVGDIDITNPGEYANCTSNKFIKISSFNSGAKFLPNNNTPQQYPILNTETFDKP